MPTLPLGSRVFVSTQPADMRKSFDGLIALTKTALQRNPLSGDLYVYVNRSATMVKVLYWTRGGFCVWAMRLERGRFAPWRSSQVAVDLTDTQLMMWLDGIELDTRRQRKRFELPARARSSATMSM
jgi:transposase